MEKRYYTVKEIAKYLVFSPNTIRKWVRFGWIPFCKMNGGIRFDIHAIDAWVQKNTRKIYHERL